MPATNTEPWMEEGLCLQIGDPESYFPEQGGSTRPSKRVCGMCDVKSECLEYALRNRERFGVWGGVSERDRRKMLREREAARSTQAA